MNYRIYIRRKSGKKYIGYLNKVITYMKSNSKATWIFFMTKRRKNKRNKNSFVKIKDETELKSSNI